MNESEPRVPSVTSDLPLLALIQLSTTGAAVVIAKAFAMVSLLAGATIASFPKRLFGALCFDFLTFGIIAAAVVSASFFRPRLNERARRVLAGIIFGTFALGTLLSFANAGFLVTLGQALDWETVLLAPSLAAYLSRSMTVETLAILAAAILLSVLPVAVTPLAWRVARRSGRWVYAIAVVLPFAAFRLARQEMPATAAEHALRRAALIYMFVPSQPQTWTDSPPPTEAQLATIARLLGPVERTTRIFEPMPRRPRNVLMVVWESVGDLYIRPNPRGEATVPNLDALIRAGSVRFRNAYAQSPLSVQSVWSFFTGRRPPAKAAIFLDRSAMPPHGPSLPEILKRAGFRTSVLIGSFTRSWGADRIIELGGVDLFEDILTMANRDRFPQRNWSLAGPALNERFAAWLDETQSKAPFFSVVWNVETHYPYNWSGMTAREEALPKEQRYLRDIENADRLLGVLLRELESRGLRDDTLIVVVGDHGEGTGRPPHPDLLLHGFRVEEDAVRVPLVLSHAALAPSQNVDAPVVIADLYPTILDLVGLPVPKEIDGVTLSRDWRPRPILLNGMQWWPSAVRAGRFKFTQVTPRQPGSLFDLVNDPAETNDLLFKEPAIGSALEAYLLHDATLRHRSDISMNADRRGFRPWMPSPEMVGQEPRPRPSPQR